MQVRYFTPPHNGHYRMCTAMRATMLHMRAVHEIIRRHWLVSCSLTTICQSGSVFIEVTMWYVAYQKQKTNKSASSLLSCGEYVQCSSRINRASIIVAVVGLNNAKSILIVVWSMVQLDSQHLKHGMCDSACILASSSPSGSVVRQGAEETSLATSLSTSTCRCSSGFTYISCRKGLLSLAASSLRPAYQVQLQQQISYPVRSCDQQAAADISFTSTEPCYTVYKLLRLVLLGLG